MKKWHPSRKLLGCGCVLVAANVFGSLLWNCVRPTEFSAYYFIASNIFALWFLMSCNRWYWKGLP